MPSAIVPIFSSSGSAFGPVLIFSRSCIFVLLAGISVRVPRLFLPAAPPIYGA